MVEIFQKLLRPKPVVAIVAMGCATMLAYFGNITSGEWGLVMVGAMWWTGSNPPK